MSSAEHEAPLRLFLDAGVLIDGFFNLWGTCKGVLILTTLRAHFRAVIADPIREELVRAVDTKTATLSPEDAQAVRDSVNGWHTYARPISLPWPQPEEMRTHASLLAAVKHQNDMPSVVAAVIARPDWILSTNTEHWNQELARRIGLRVATPAEFLASLHT